MLVVYKWEILKLLAQMRVRVALGFCLVGPFVFDLALGLQDRLPKDQVFGRFLHASGFASPLFLLGFAALWAFPLLTALVAGDIFASEDQHGTLKSLLTRSRSRAQVFAGKVAAAVTFSLVAIVAFGASATAAGMSIIGTQPLLNLSGSLISSSAALQLVAASWMIALMPVIAFTSLAIMLSVVTRNTAVGVVGPIVIGLLMQMYSFLNGADAVRHLMLTDSFNAWHGLAHAPSYTTPIVHAALTSSAYTIMALAIAYVSFRRRDVTGG